MRLGLISDLHIDSIHYTPQDYLSALIHVSRIKGIDTLVIGGDISNSQVLTLNFVEMLQRDLGIPVYFVPGNHDLWNRQVQNQDSLDSWAIYNNYKAHPQSLLASPRMITAEVGLVGHTAWYNHAIYDHEQFSPEQVTLGRYKGVWWQDKKFIDWGYSDQEVSRQFTQQIESDIQHLTEAKEIILVTHIVTTNVFTMPLPHRVFDFFNAYIYTDDVEPLYARYPIRYSVMGHVHFRGTHVTPNTTFITNSLGYVKEWRSPDMIKEITHALAVIELK